MEKNKTLISIKRLSVVDPTPTITKSAYSISQSGIRQIWEKLLVANYDMCICPVFDQ